MSRGLGDVYKRQIFCTFFPNFIFLHIPKFDSAVFSITFKDSGSVIFSALMVNLNALAPSLSAPSANSIFFSLEKHATILFLSFVYKHLFSTIYDSLSVSTFIVSIVLGNVSIIIVLRLLGITSSFILV